MVRERVDRPVPGRRHELVVVVRTVLAVGCGCDEEPRVVTTRRAERCEPVREEPQLAGSDDEGPRFEQVDEAEVTGVHTGAGGGERRVVGDRPAGPRLAGEQDAGFLEALTDRGDPEAEP